MRRSDALPGIAPVSAVVISLCDLTGQFVQPWVDAGCDAILVDPQHGFSSATPRGFARAVCAANLRAVEVAA
jgi:hypothetical protein